jgi:hypothetical protein
MYVCVCMSHESHLLYPSISSLSSLSSFSLSLSIYLTYLSHLSLTSSLSCLSSLCSLQGSPTVITSLALLVTLTLSPLSLSHPKYSSSLFSFTSHIYISHLFYLSPTSLTSCLSLCSIGREGLMKFEQARQQYEEALMRGTERRG